MRPWAEFLAEAGYAVEVPRLPGHGTAWRDMNATTWEDWYAEVSQSLDKLVAENDLVAVAGLGMGGGLALQLAANRTPDVAGLVLVNPAVNTTSKELLPLPVLRYLVTGLPGVRNDIKKEDVEDHGYPMVPIKALDSMKKGWKALRRDLRKVTAPILMFRSTVDHVVDPSSGQIILKSVSSKSVAERSLEDSFHVATLDNDAPAIFEESLKFLQSLATKQD